MILPAGFVLVRGWAAAVTVAEVTRALAWHQPTIRLYGREVAVPRLTCWMGDGAYTYSGRRHEPAAIPSVIADLHDRVEAATGARFNSVLANLYRDGSDSVAWHADDEPELGHEPVIASLSLGASRVFKVRHNASRQVTSIALEHGDLLVMSGASQRDYQHAVPKTARPVGQRVNLTFRAVA